MSLETVFSVDVVHDLAHPRSYLRGVAYHRQGRVEHSTGSGGLWLEAAVRGTRPYLDWPWLMLCFGAVRFWAAPTQSWHDVPAPP